MKSIYRSFFHISFVVLVVVPRFSYGNCENIDSTIQIGQPIPEIVFDHVRHSQRKTFSTKYLNDRPSVIYFFSAVCRGSFQHLSEINRMYSEYQDNFNLIMVGIDLDDGIQGIYEKYERRYDLNLPIVFDKSVYKQYNVRGVPHVIWIDKRGIVQAITNVLDHEYLEQFVEGKEFDFISYDTEGKEKLRKFNPDEPFLVNGNGGESQDFIQRSVISQWKIGMPNDMPYAESNKSPLEGLKYLQAIGRELADLYRIAYFGKTYGWYPGDSAYGNYHYSPILEIEDKSKFESDYNLGKNLYCYSQVLPPERRNPTEMMVVMRGDLKNYFGYEVEVETRQMPYLSLVVTGNANKKLLNHGRSGESSHSLTKVHYINKPIFSLISILSYYLNLTLSDLPLIDETGIQGNIDITFDAILTDFESVITALQRQGLDIVQKEKPMKTIVIKEPKL